MKKGFLLFLGIALFTYSKAQTQAVYTLQYSVSHSAGWIKLGDLTMNQGGNQAVVRINGGSGYNASADQMGYVELHIRTSNGGSVDADNYGFSARTAAFGRNKFVVKIKIVPNVSGATSSSYAIFAYCTAFVGNSFYTVEQSSGTYTPSNTPSLDPGTAYEVPFEYFVNSDSYFLNNTGIGTTSPNGRLTILGNTQTDSFSSTALSLEQPYGSFSGSNSNNLVGASTLYRTNNGPDSWKLAAIAGVVGTPNDISGFPGGIAFFTKPADGQTNSNPIERMRIDEKGNLGIGTITPSADAKLTVAGKIHSREVKVTIDAGADFVFQKDYDLKPLSEVAEYISENKHLPEIASAAEMKRNGLELGEMNIKLLQKIEELTLYMIDFKKEMDLMKSENKTLKLKVAQLEAAN